MRNSILHYGVPSVSLCSKMKYFCGVLLQISNLHSRLWHLPKTAAKKYRTWKTREYQRLRCEVRFEENKLLLLLLLLLLLVLVFMYALLYGCHAEGVNRRHRGALCSAYVGRAVRCACGSSPAPEPRVLYYDCYFAETNEAKRGAAVDKAHGAVMDIAAATCQSSRIWPHAFVGLLGDLASTRPCHMGRALMRDS